MPNFHLWIESENREASGMDSLSDFGPITKKMIAGEVSAVVWPPWRWEFIESVEKRVLVSRTLAGKNENHFSKGISDHEISQLYGRPKYNDDDPDNSPIPGWTKGR